MAELTISSEEIQGAIESYVASFSSETSREEIGIVSDTGDGIAHVEGLPSAMTQELLEFSGGILGVALNLDEGNIGAVIPSTIVRGSAINFRSRASNSHDGTYRLP